MEATVKKTNMTEQLFFLVKDMPIFRPLIAVLTGGGTVLLQYTPPPDPVMSDPTWALVASILKFLAIVFGSAVTFISLLIKGFELYDTVNKRFKDKKSGKNF